MSKFLHAIIERLEDTMALAENLHACIDETKSTKNKKTLEIKEREVE